jgi:hypothetical protein
MCFFLSFRFLISKVNSASNPKLETLGSLLTPPPSPTSDCRSEQHQVSVVGASRLRIESVAEDSQFEASYVDVKREQGLLVHPPAYPPKIVLRQDVRFYGATAGVRQLKRPLTAGSVRPGLESDLEEFGWPSGAALGFPARNRFLSAGSAVAVQRIETVSSRPEVVPITGAAALAFFEALPRNIPPEGAARASGYDSDRHDGVAAACAVAAVESGAAASTAAAGAEVGGGRFRPVPLPRGAPVFMPVG